MVVVGNETAAEDTLADGEKKTVAVAEVELADVEEAPAEDVILSCVDFCRVNALCDFVVCRLL